MSHIIETFREFGLHQMHDSQTTLDYMITLRLLSRIYSHISSSNLMHDSNNIIQTNQIIISNGLELLIGWLAYALDLCSSKKLSVIGLKIVLSTLSNAKPVDKFRCTIIKNNFNILFTCI